jgi:NADH:ubiquinone oxidoreductase subunit F (NADH-binding)
MAGSSVPVLGIGGLVELCGRSRMCGRGGAGFPLAQKLQAVHEAAQTSGCAPRIVINGEEGEPASVKDRALMMLSPDLVLDGAQLVAGALGADRVHVYVADLECRRVLGRRIALRNDALVFALFAAEPGYVSGEETAVVRALNGGPAKPTSKPPRPFSDGVAELPTLVANVETLAQLANLVRRGAAAASLEREASEGTVLLTVSTDRDRRVLIEVPSTVCLRSVLQYLSLWPDLTHPEVILGGFFGSFVPAAGFEAPLGHQSMRESDLSLGCGAVMLLTETCPVTAVAEILHHLERENAHQCGPCFRGIPAMLAGIEALADGTATDETVEKLRTWSVSLRGRGACGTLDAATGVLASLLAHHHDLTETHVRSPCGSCRQNTGRPPASSWASPSPLELKEDQ